MKLAALIRKHRLGTVTEVKTINPNTKHAISTWVWVYNGNQIKDEPTKVKKEDKEKQPEVTQEHQTITAPQLGLVVNSSGRLEVE